MPRPSKTSVTVEPGTLYGLGHYHQAAGRNPTAKVIPEEMEAIELVTHGRGWVMVKGGDWLEVLPGTLLWHVQGDSTIGRSDFDNPYHCLAVRFAVPAQGEEQRAVPQVSQWSDLEAVRTFTNEVVSWYARGKIKPQTVLSYILSRLRFQIELHENREARQSMPQPLQELIRYIDENYGEKIDLQTMRRITQWSIPQLHKSFREHLGKSPHKWLLNRRITAARERLANSNHPIKAIAVDCGFYSAAAFCAHFKRATQMTPNSYRRQMTRV